MSRTWTEFYNTEEELVADMLKCKSDEKKYNLYALVKGYAYVEGFKRYYAKNGKLTEKQMIQLKRLAGNIKYNVTGRDI